MRPVPSSSLSVRPPLVESKVQLTFHAHGGYLSGHFSVATILTAKGVPSRIWHGHGNATPLPRQATEGQIRRAIAAAAAAEWGLPW